MKVEDIRNVGIAGHGGVGKTILAEAMLYSAGVINRMGTIAAGNTVSDFHRQEIDRQISISTSMLNFVWKDHHFNVIDSPGYLDFIGEVYGAMHVVDTGLILIDAAAGLEVGTEFIWNYAKQHDLGKLFVLNKLDKEDINFSQRLDEIQAKFGSNAVVVQFPYKTGEGFNSIIDMIRGKMLVFEINGKGSYTEQPIPEDVKDRYDDYRVSFMESIIEHDDALMNKYLEDEEVSEEELKKALSHACKHNQIYPILCVSGQGNVGVSRLLEIIEKYGASASDPPDVHGKDANGNRVQRKCSKDEALSLQIFKTISEPHVGELSFVKVYSGTLRVGMDVFNANNLTSERISTLYRLNGKNRADIQQLECGDMGAIIKLKHSHTNDSLCDPENPIILGPIRFPETAIRAALRVPNKGEEDRVSMALGSLHQEDPTFHFNFDSELRETIVSGQGELQLDVVVQRLKNRFNVTVELDEPKIPYRETVTKSISIRRKYKKQTGGRGQYADVHIEVKPLHRGGGFQFVNNIVGGVIPTKFIPAVEKGLHSAMAEGCLVGSNIVDFSVRLFDGSYHNVDSSDMAFQVAGSQALKEAVTKAAPIVLEPIYELEIRIPEEYMGAVMGDVSSRRGKVLGMEADGTVQIIRAEVPLAELWKYSSSLRSMSQGSGVHTRKFSHYDPIPRDLRNKLIEAFQVSKDEDR